MSVPGLLGYPFLPRIRNLDYHLIHFGQGGGMSLVPAEGIVWNHTAFKGRIRRYLKFFRRLVREEYENKNKLQKCLKHFVAHSSVIYLMRNLL